MDEIKTRDERIAELLDKSAAEAVSAIKGPTLADLAQEEPEEKVTPDPEEEETPTGGKKVRIPASRLKTLTSELEQLRQQVQGFQGQQERIATLEQQVSKKDESELPEWWTDMYGDTDLSRKAYLGQERIMKEQFAMQSHADEARKAQEAAQHAERLKSIEDSLDNQMEAVQEEIGRELTDNQMAEIMEIVNTESESFKDSDGKFTNLIPVSTAYKIWQQQKPSEAKQEMARIAGLQSSGGSELNTQGAERPQWGDWRKRLGA